MLAACVYFKDTTPHLDHMKLLSSSLSELPDISVVHIIIAGVIISASATIAMNVTLWCLS